MKKLILFTMIILFSACRETNVAPVKPDSVVAGNVRSKALYQKLTPNK